MAILKTKKGVEILVDEDIYQKYKSHNWTLVKGYPYSYTIGYLHWLVIPQEPNKITDHINRNLLDNRRENLRITDKATNRHNSKLNSNSSTGYKGVRWRDGYGWRAVITFAGRRKHIGYYETAKEASAAYEAKAKELYGPN